MGYKNPLKEKEYQSAYKASKKYQAIMKLGGKCCRCGFSDIRALCVDHINGGGHKELSKISSVGVYLKVIRGETGYQCLCMNCNWIKRDENGE